MENMKKYRIVGIRLPNGMVQVARNEGGATGEILTESAFRQKYGMINEGTSPDCIILESING